MWYIRHKHSHTHTLAVQRISDEKYIDREPGLEPSWLWRIRDATGEGAQGVGVGEGQRGLSIHGSMRAYANVASRYANTHRHTHKKEKRESSEVQSAEREGERGRGREGALVHLKSSQIDGSQRGCHSI